ncbi:endonuclease/exonuclease/phosphatase family protein [Gangjinia marincola]|uniref:Endonuclease/exonuclease/phosphatase family protein n=2 Tax=Gangjinia marincola TaxID=578463 RepID=A0ABP3XT14_9FLAO
MIYQAWFIFPYTVLSSRKDKLEKVHDGFTLLTANVFQDNNRKEDFLALVHKYNPDVFVTMESDQTWENALTYFNSSYPHQINHALENYYGIHLYSKHELDNHDVYYIVKEGIPSIDTKVNLPSGHKLRLVCLHPEPPSPSEHENSKPRDAELMIKGKELRDTNDTIVVCGDMNDVVWSKTTRLFKKLTNLIDPREGRGFYPTFHAKYWFLRFPLDHLFHSKDCSTHKIKSLPYYGSDHFAMFYQIGINTEMYVDNSKELQEDEKDTVEDFIEAAKEEQPIANITIPS